MCSVGRVGLNLAIVEVVKCCSSPSYGRSTAIVRMVFLENSAVARSGVRVTVEVLCGKQRKWWRLSICLMDVTRWIRNAFIRVCDTAENVPAAERSMDRT